MNSSEHKPGNDFDALTPELILGAVEQAGFRPTGEYSQLNSYENRVFDVFTEDSARLIAKFYRPNRWTDLAIVDEHQFLAELQAEGISAVAPLILKNHKTIVTLDKYRATIFPRVLGRNPQEFLAGELKQVGRLLARIHNVGARKTARHRQTLDAKTFGWDLLPRLQNFVYPELWNAYVDVSERILEFLEDELVPENYIRIHGDCHKGNLLHSGEEFFFVDFDDFVNGPEVQDFWMLLSGISSDIYASREYDEMCTGYEELRNLPDDWHLIEGLRGLRIISYAAWIANRWNDPFFKRIFPTFTTYNYWAEELQALERIASTL